MRTGYVCRFDSFSLFFRKNALPPQIFVLFCECAKTHFATQISQKFLTIPNKSVKLNIFSVKLTIFYLRIGQKPQCISILTKKIRVLNILWLLNNFVKQKK